MSDEQVSELGAQNNLNVVQPPMAQGGGARSMALPTPEQINRANEEARRQRLEYFAQQIYVEALRIGRMSLNARTCAQEAKALYAELDRKEGDDGGGHEE